MGDHEFARQLLTCTTDDRGVYKCTYTSVHFTAVTWRQEGRWRKSSKKSLIVWLVFVPRGAPATVLCNHYMDAYMHYSHSPHSVYIYSYIAHIYGTTVDCSRPNCTFIAAAVLCLYYIMVVRRNYATNNCCYMTQKTVTPNNNFRRKQ